jgi:phosphate transport system protein
MGDLAEHVAKVVLLRAPQSAVPALVRDDIAAMSAVARRQADALATTIAHHDEAGANRLDTADDAMDVLHRRLFDVIAGPAWTYPVHVAIDVALTSRYLERFADHAVTAARRVHFLVTGSYAPDRPEDH